MSDALAGFKTVETVNGWRFGSQAPYANACCIACPCGHLSVRDRDEVAAHVCPACGRIPTHPSASREVA